MPSRLFFTPLIFFCIVSAVIFSAGRVQSQDREKKVEVPKTGSVSPDSPTVVTTEERKPTSLSGGPVAESPTSKCRVLKAYLSSTGVSTAGLNDKITIEISNLYDLLKESKSSSQRIIPYIDGIPIKGVYQDISSDIEKGMLVFELVRNELSSDAWKKLLSKPDLWALSKSVEVSVALENEKPIRSDVDSFSLLIIRKSSAVTWFIILLVFGFVLIYLAIRFDMLCEPDSLVKKGAKRPYSLALAQMAFWYYLVVGSIIFLYNVTKEFPEITGSVLTLIGISSVTALGSAAINKNKRVDTDNNLMNLNSEKTVLSERLSDIKELLKQKHPADLLLELKKEKETKEIRLNEVTNLIAKYNASSNYFVRQGFWKDILTDTSGISLHRFQILVWTLVFGFYFLVNVWTKLSLPVFDDTLLALMGISSGTYLGFKIPEQKL